MQNSKLTLLIENARRDMILVIWLRQLVMKGL